MCVFVRAWETTKFAEELSDARSPARRCVLQADAVTARVTDAAGAIRRTSVKPVSIHTHLQWPWKALGVFVEA